MLRHLFCSVMAIFLLLSAATLWAKDNDKDKVDEDPAAAVRREVHDEVAKMRDLSNFKAATLTDDQIVASMKRAIDYLFKNKTAKDNWESVDSWSKDPAEGEMKGGETALVLLALLEAGKSIDDPRLIFHSPELAPVVDYIMKLRTDRTYVLGLKAAVLGELPQAKEFPYNAELKLLKENLVASAELNYAYGYSLKKENNAPLLREETGFSIPYKGKTLTPKWRWDLSNSQYALLGVWAAGDANIPVPPDYWGVQDSLWRAAQCRSGAWSYDAPVDLPSRAYDYRTGEKIDGEFPASTFQKPTITAAGLASLYVTQEFLDTEVRAEPRVDPVLANGLKNFTENLDTYYVNGYYLYGVERVGLASGYKYFGKTDWYREIACTLLACQQEAGAWQYSANVGTSPNVGTAYGLLTLARGRNPVLFNKLQCGATWDARPRDAANITRWMAKTFERPLNWQIVNLQVPGDEWLDAPILLITGSRDPKFTKDDMAKLKAFVDGGGMILSSPDNGSEPFTTAMKKYAADLENRQYEMRILPKTHPIFNIQFPIAAPTTYWGLSNGSRELWIHSIIDLGAAWQRKASNTKPALAFEIPANIYFYATGRGKLRARLQPLTPLGGEVKTTVTIARVEYAGNWDPEPGAWPRFARVAQAIWSAGVKIETVKAADLDPAKTPIAHLTGTAKYAFTAAEIAGFKAYVEKGGTLLIDSAGGDPEFAKTAQDLIKDLAVGEVIPIFAQDDLFTAKAPNTAAVTEFNYRGPVLQQFAGKKPDGPLLQGVKIKGRWAIVYSSIDLASGLLGSHTWLAGYDPETAEAIIRNMVMSVTTPNKAAQPPPAVIDEPPPKGGPSMPI